MFRSGYQGEIERLEAEIQTLGDLVQTGIDESLRILEAGNKAAAERLIEWDQTVNERRFAIEHEVLSLIATQQPVAGDMRILAAMLEIVTELERIGDYAKGIARISLLLDERPIEDRVLALLRRMGAAATSMLSCSLAAFASRDAQLARQVCLSDDEVDELFERVFLEVAWREGLDDESAVRANYLVWTAHNLERTADRATNICERVIYTVTGELVEAADILRRAG